jgi:hypothetical protein
LNPGVLRKGEIKLGLDSQGNKFRDQESLNLDPGAQIKARIKLRGWIAWKRNLKAERA